MADKIVSVTFNYPPEGQCFTGPGNVRVDMETAEGEKDSIFYYDDEISFDFSELIGKTFEEAHDLRLRKDIVYIQTAS